MKMQRIKTNIIELSELKKTPCTYWLLKFHNGTIDAHKAFKQYGERYSWLYENSDYDLIGWEIENEVFNWDGHSWAAAQYCPEKLDPEKYNWEICSWAVAKYCPDKLDPERYNWERDSCEVAKYCPDKLDPERFNWEDGSGAVAKYCPEKLEPERFNWEDFGEYVIECCPEKLSLMPERYKQLNNVKQ